MNSILHYPYEGSVLEQPAKLIDFFQKIQYYIIESQDDDNDGVSEPDPEQEAQAFEERMSQLKGNE